MKGSAVMIVKIAWFVSIASAISPPKVETAREVVPKATNAIRGTLVSCSVTSEPGFRVLRATIRPEQSLWGEPITKVLETSYKEGQMPPPTAEVLPMLIYTGSGIEFTLTPGKSYVWLLKEVPGRMELLRVEPETREAHIVALHTASLKRSESKDSAK